MKKMILSPLDIIQLVSGTTKHIIQVYLIRGAKSSSFESVFIWKVQYFERFLVLKGSRISKLKHTPLYGVR